MADAFIPLAAAPPHLQLHGAAYEEKLDWLQYYIHGVLGFKRGETLQVWDPVRRGWHVRGPKREPLAGDTPDPGLRPQGMPKRGPGGRFLKREG